MFFWDTVYVDQEIVVSARHQSTVSVGATLLSMRWPTGNIMVGTQKFRPCVSYYHIHLSIRYQCSCMCYKSCCSVRGLLDQKIKTRQD